MQQSDLCLFLPLLSTALFGLSCGAHAANCAGPNEESHPYGGLTFHTNSRVDPSGQDNYRYGIVSCVDHNDPVNSLKVHWLIPLVHGWVPPTQILQSVPRLTVDNNAPQLPGCILYGDRGDTTSATFLAIDGDRRKVDDERQRGCRAAVENPNPSSSLIQDVLFRIKNFFPSNPANPNATMLQLDGVVGIKAISSSSYNSYFEYEVKPYSNSEGSPDSVTVQPSFAGVTEALLPAFFKQNEKPISLGSKGRISFNVYDVGSPQLAYASYDLYAPDKQLIAGVGFPVFVGKK